MANWQNPPDEIIKRLLSSSKTIAVVGCSPSPDRTSHHIASAMQRRGYRIIPVHPSRATILGEQAYGQLEDIPADIAIDIVDVFRRADEVVPVAQSAVRRGARALWLQQGIVNEEAWRVATSGGLLCIMDACIAVMHRVLFAPEGSRPAAH